MLTATYSVMADSLRKDTITSLHYIMSWCLVSVSRSRRPYHCNPLMTCSRRVKVDQRTDAGCISDSCYTRMLHTDCQEAHLNCLTGRAIGVGMW